MTDMALLLERGRLTQVCPSCGTTEAAGAYCTKCSTPTGQAHWQRRELSDAQREAVAVRAAKRQFGASRGSVNAETANPEAS